MLPNSIARIDPKLTVIAPLLRRVKSTEVQALVGIERLAERDYDRIFSNCLEIIEDLLRGSGDIAHDSRLKLLSQPGKQIARIDLLLAETGPDHAFRRLVIVEDKLLKNNESRRGVLAQILEYAHIVQSSLEPDDWPDKDGWVGEYREEIRRAMRMGNYLLIICGDVIHDDLHDLLRSYVNRLNPANQSDLVLLAMAVYSDGDTNVLVPHVVGGTERVGRDLTIRVEIQTASGTAIEPQKIQVVDTPEPDRTGRRPSTLVIDPAEFMTAWEKVTGQQAAYAWRTFVDAVNRASIAGLGWGHLASGAPYLYLSNISIGQAGILRLTSMSPLARDMLQTQIWDTTPAAQDARHEFRQALLSSVPGATLSGKFKRVDLPIEAIAAHSVTVVQALTDLAAKLRLSTTV